MIFNLPNILTLSRIIVIPLILGLMMINASWAAWTALVFYSLACITDYFDGYLARLNSQLSLIGKFLDPIADKLLVSAVLFVLTATHRIENLNILPALIILLREVLVSGLREFLISVNVGLPVSYLAKWKTTIQMIMLGFLIVGDWGPAEIPTVWIGITGLWIAAILTLVTGWDYMRIGLQHMIDD